MRAIKRRFEVWQLLKTMAIVQCGVYLLLLFQYTFLVPPGKPPLGNVSFALMLCCVSSSTRYTTLYQGLIYPTSKAKQYSYQSLAAPNVVLQLIVPLWASETLAASMYRSDTFILDVEQVVPLSWSGCVNARMSQAHYCADEHGLIYSKDALIPPATIQRAKSNQSNRPAFIFPVTARTAQFLLSSQLETRYTAPWPCAGL
jgi:hypothetical protein